jgi:hypothetical protein
MIRNGAAVAELLQQKPEDSEEEFAAKSLVGPALGGAGDLTLSPDFARYYAHPFDFTPIRP